MATNFAFDIAKYQKLLKNSPTALTPNVTPSASDINLEKKLLQTQAQQEYADADKLRDQWYGTDDKREQSSGSYLSKVLHGLGAPLYGVVGGVEAILGKGTESGLSNVEANIKEKGTFGDLLRMYNVPQAAALPLGFALDIFADPLVWATAGTSAFVPRVLTGAAKGVQTGKGLIKGASLAAKSGVLTKAEKFGRIIPGLEKRAFPAAVENASQGVASKAFRSISKAASESDEAFGEFIGKSMSDRLINSYNKHTMGEQIREKLSTTPNGQRMLDAFELAPQKFYDTKMAEAIASKNVVNNSLDEFAEAGGLFADTFKTGFKNNPKSFENHLEDSIGAIFKPMEKTIDDSADLMKEMGLLAGEEKAYKASVKESLKDILTALKSNNQNKTIEKLMGKSGEELLDIGSVFKFYETNMDWYDRKVANVIMKPAARKVMRTYAQFIGLFKTAKIGPNPSTWMNAIIGNPTMAAMHGIDITNPGYFRETKNMLKVVRGKDEKAVLNYLNEPEIRRVWETAPDLFWTNTGINPRLATGDIDYYDDFERTIRKALKDSGQGDEGLQEIREAFNSSFYGGEKKYEKLKNTIKNTKEGTIAGAIADVEATAGQRATSVNRAIDENLLGSAFMTSEVRSGPFGDWVRKVDAAAERGTPGAKMASWYLNKPMEGYNKIDQGYRLALVQHLWKDGISANELTSITKRIKINPENIVKVADRNLWKIKPMDGFKIASVVYMNYLAMPGFVRAMRSLPVLGAPFMSFAYGMGSHSLGTLRYNPALFNKVQFLLHEISGSKSPLEKEAMEGPYYDWLDREGMVKLPFFADNPVYLNTENWLPYYTMNIFQPQERTYEDKFGSAAATFIDKIPFFKTPEGQLLFDYLVQPMILQNEDPRGAFDQPLFPKGASTIDKVARGVSATAEMVVPPITGLAGLFLPPASTTFADKAIDYIPSYRWQRLAYAMRGKGAHGVPKKQPKTGQVLQQLGGLVGFPTYELKKQYGNQQSK